MKEQISKIFKITFITIGVLAGVLACLAVLNIIFPNIEYFGHKFVLENYNENETTLDNYSYNIYNINITTTDYNIKILADKEIDGWASYQLKGFHLGISNAEKLTPIVHADGNNLDITLLEPLGWVASFNGLLTLKVSPDFMYNITVTTNKGDTNITGIDISNLNLISKKGDFTVVGKDKTAIMQSINIITKSGDINFLAYENIEIIKPSFISTTSSNITFKNIYANMTIYGSKINFKAGNIYVYDRLFEIFTSSGELVANNLNTGSGSFLLSGASCKVSIKEVVGDVALTTTSGNISINNLNAYQSILQTTSGNVVVTNANENAFIMTEAGNIVVNKYYKSGQFASTSGDINVTSVSPFNINYYTVITTNSGNVTFENNINKSIVTILDGGKANIKVWKVAQTNNVEHRVNNIKGTTSIAIMADKFDIMRFRLVGSVQGSMMGVQLFADDSFIIIPQTANYSNQTTFYGTGGQIKITQLDPR